MDNMENTDVMALLDTLSNMISDAWGVPLGNDKCVIERKKAEEIISDIKANLPSALAEAKRLVSARDEFIGTAKKEAEAIRKTAEENAARMVDEKEIVRAAAEKANQTIAAANESARAINRRCYEYVNSVMSDAEARLNASISAITATRDAFNTTAGEKLGTAPAAEEPAEDPAEAEA